MNHFAQLANLLAAADTGACRVVTGFDGFVDEMITLVGERRGWMTSPPCPTFPPLAGWLRPRPATAACARSSSPTPTPAAAP
ncbi:MAG: hypothetical protein U1F77_19690 [Kiritimatiellia bacterium]